MQARSASAYMCAAATEVGGRHARDLLDGLRRVGLDQLGHGLVALGALGHEALVDQPVADDHVRQAVQQRGVGARPHAEVELAVVGELDAARVGGDQLQALDRRLLDAGADDRVALGRVHADQQRHVGRLDVVERAGGAGQAERLAQRERRRRVAHARAVVDVVRADRGAHQALHHVAVLVGRARGGEPGDRVRPVLGLDAAERVGDARDRLVPGRQPEAAVLADERRGQPIARARELVGEAALDAGVALVGRAVHRRADRGDAPVGAVGLEPAADAAVAAGRGRRRVEARSHAVPPSPVYAASHIEQRVLGDGVGRAGVGAGAAGHACRVGEAAVEPCGDAGVEAAARWR